MKLNPWATYEEALETLRDKFGYASFRPGQDDAVRAIMNSRDVLAIMPTGSGKSLIYQVPSLLLGGVTVCVSSLVSLMKDQVDQFHVSGFRAIYLNSSLSAGKQEWTLKRIAEGCFQLVYVTPERLDDPKFLEVFDHVDVPLIAIDEAHCVSSWGHDFRPDYKRIKGFIESREFRPRVVALTATATKETQEDIKNLLGLINPVEVSTNLDRPNIVFSVKKMPSKQKLKWVIDYAKKRPDDCGIIYCNTQMQTDTLCANLCNAGIKAVNYHSEVPAAKKETNQNAFANGSAKVMVATSAFGMGVNKSDIRYVVNYNMPLSVEDYYQQAGRAGRDGKPSESVLLWNEGDVHTALRIIGKKWNNLRLPEGEVDKACENRKKLVDVMREYCETEGCRGNFILKYFGEDNPEVASCGHCDCCLEGGKKPKIKKPRKPKVDPVAGNVSRQPAPSPSRELALREMKRLRHRLADGASDSRVFSDKALAAICNDWPTSIDELLDVDGVGRVGARKYGAQFIELIKTLPQPKDTPARIMNKKRAKRPAEEKIPEIGAALLDCVESFGEDVPEALLLAIVCGKDSEGVREAGACTMRGFGSGHCEYHEAGYVLNRLIAYGLLDVVDVHRKTIRMSANPPGSLAS